MSSFRLVSTSVPNVFGRYTDLPVVEDEYGNTYFVKTADGHSAMNNVSFALVNLGCPATFETKIDGNTITIM